MGALNDFNECSQNSAPATPDAPPQTQSGDRRCRSNRGCPRARPLARGLADLRSSPRGRFTSEGPHLGPCTCRRSGARRGKNMRPCRSRSHGGSSGRATERQIVTRYGAGALCRLPYSFRIRQQCRREASTAAGGLVSLASAAVAALVRAGVDERSATRALLPLMRSAIGGIERRGLRGALTGPIIRGDWEVVDQHLQALPSDLRNLYLSLAQQSLRLASPSLSSEATRALRRVLQAWRRLLKRRE